MSVAGCSFIQCTCMLTEEQRELEIPDETQKRQVL